MPEKRVIWYVHPYAGGPGVGRYDRPYHLCAQWNEMGHRAVVLTPSFHHLLDNDKNPGAAVINGVRYNFLYSPKYKGNGLGRLFNMFFFALQLFLKGGFLAKKYGVPDLIISSSPHPYAFIAAQMLAKRFGAHCTFEVRDLWPLSLIELAGLRKNHPLVKLTGWVESRAYRLSDSVVSLLPCTKSYMLQHGLKESRWVYIPNGVKVTDTIAPAPSSVADSDPMLVARKWKSQGKLVIAYTGALGAPNYVESLVQAMAIQKGRGCKSAALIVGRGELQVEIEKLIKQLELEDCVALFPQIPKLAVTALLQEVDVGFISLRPEPIFRFGVSPNKLFDYMLASLPVIFAVKAGNNPVLESGCGYSVDPGSPAEISEAISNLINLGETRRLSMGELGSEWVKSNHGYSQLARNYLELLG